MSNTESKKQSHESPTMMHCKRVLMIDNYDSFTYNLVHYLEELGAEVTVKRNDQLNLAEVENFEYIILSPGPGIPDEAGLLKPIIKEYGGTKNILGICLGHQAIAEVYGGTLNNLDQVYHGIATPITLLSKEGVFKNLDKNQQVGRYHSWIVDHKLPDCLEITATDIKGEIMALRHKSHQVQGLQFHPESVLTPNGKKMMENWLFG